MRHLLFNVTESQLPRYMKSKEGVQMIWKVCSLKLSIVLNEAQQLKQVSHYMFRVHVDVVLLS